MNRFQKARHSLNIIFIWEGWTRLAAVAAVVALWLTGQQLLATQKQVHLAERAAITEQYLSSVTQIASTNQLIRLAGIRSLERLENESPTERETLRLLLRSFLLMRDLNSNSEDCTPVDPDVNLAVKLYLTNFQKDFNVKVKCVYIYNGNVHIRFDMPLVTIENYDGISRTTWNLREISADKVIIAVLNLDQRPFQNLRYIQVDTFGEARIIK